MSTLAVTNTLMSVFVPVGIAGAVIALLCALVAAYAMVRGSAGLCAGAVGLWIVGTVLSLAASFSSLWTPVLVALIAMSVALIVGGIVRLLVRRRPAPAI